MPNSILFFQHSLCLSIYYIYLSCCAYNIVVRHFSFLSLVLLLNGSKRLLTSLTCHLQSRRSLSFFYLHMRTRSHQNNKTILPKVNLGYLILFPTKHKWEQSKRRTKNNIAYKRESCSSALLLWLWNCSENHDRQISLKLIDFYSLISIANEDLPRGFFFMLSLVSVVMSQIKWEPK